MGCQIVVGRPGTPSAPGHFRCGCLWKCTPERRPRTWPIDQRTQSPDWSRRKAEWSRSDEGFFEVNDLLCSSRHPKLTNIAVPFSAFRYTLGITSSIFWMVPSTFFSKSRTIRLYQLCQPDQLIHSDQADQNFIRNIPLPRKVLPPENVACPEFACVPPKVSGTSGPYRADRSSATLCPSAPNSLAGVRWMCPVRTNCFMDLGF